MNRYNSATKYSGNCSGINCNNEIGYSSSPYCKKCRKILLDYDDSVYIDLIDKLK
jgi:hypothetical protein